MYLKQSFRKESGRTYLVIAKKVRNKETGNSSDVTVESLGYLDEFEKQYPDPIAHFQEVAKKMTEEENERHKVTLMLDMDEELPIDYDSRKNFGYAAILKIYHELELDRFFNNKARHQGFKFNTNSIMLMLVVSRMLSPGSKKKAFEEKTRYFERFNFSLADVYRALSHFDNVAIEAQRHIHERVVAKYGSDTSTVYYDVTNFYFEIDKEDDLRKRGVSKEHRPNPIIQMGLAMDADGVPLHYELFKGNTQDKTTFRSVIGEVIRNYNTGRIVVVADMGIITGDNIYYLVGGEKREKALHGYVLSFSVRGGTKAFIEYVLDSEGYSGTDGKPLKENADFKVKSRVEARVINVTMDSGKIAKKTVYEKQVVFWSQKYADKARAEREAVLLKAKDLVNDPKKYNKATAYGAAKYVKNINFDKDTGEIVIHEKNLIFDEAKVKEEEKLDGYYAIVTSEREMSDQEIIETYWGLWEIEQTFGISKGDMEARPIYVSLAERIGGHFLSCFIPLVIIRILQKKTDRRFSSEKIADCLKRIACVSEQDNIYLFNFRSEISETIGAALDIDFTKKRMRLSDIKHVLANCKK